MARALNKPRQTVADLERELQLRDERIHELKDEIDETRDLLRRMEEHVQEGDEEFEHFITVFDMEEDADGMWRWSKFFDEHYALEDRHDDLITRYNKLVHRFNRNIARVNPVGRPIAASEAQQEQIARHHKAGKSARWIAEEMTLSRRTVTTVIDKLDGTDRTTAKHRQRLGLEPKRKDWRPAAIQRLPKRVTAHFEKGRKLRKEARG